MYLHVEQIPVEQIRPTNILPQTSYWGRVKQEQGFSTLSFQLSLSNDLLYNDVSSHEFRMVKK